MAAKMLGMSLLITLFIISLLAVISDAQGYSQRYRPQFHYSPALNWMNDPNGLVFHNGKYHLFYQYNPTGIVWGNISWGHAVSDDLMHWLELPVALDAFDTPSGPLAELYFSGSAVIDSKSTSGWGNAENPPLVAVFTSQYTKDMILPSNKTVKSGQQSQSIAYSLDEGLTWTEYEENPVLLEPPAQYADQYQNFRDPFVFWYAPDRHWVMIVSLAAQHKLLLYTSFDLKMWTQTSELGPFNAVGGVWECPSMFPLQVDGNCRNNKWVVVVGLNPGGAAFPQASGMQYIIGSFNGTQFTADTESLLAPPTPVQATTFEDWSESTFAASNWTPTGDFVGRGPSGGIVLTMWDKGDGDVGTLTSRQFNVSSKYIQFQIECCYNPYNVSIYGTPYDTETAINLLINGSVVCSTTGVSGSNIAWNSWDVSNLIGQKVQIQLVDAATGSYGHLEVGRIVFTDSPLPPEANWVDWGPDYYAAVPWNGLPTAERVTIGWMNDWAYGANIPTSPWRSAMSIPRRLELKTINGKIQLIQQPISSILSLEGKAPLYQRFWQNIPTGNIKLPIEAKTLDLEMIFHPGPQFEKFGILLRADHELNGVYIGYELATNQLFVNRSSAGDSLSSPLFTGVYYAPLTAGRDGRISIRVLLDWSSVEVFGGQGESVITAQLFPSDSSLGVALFSVGGTEEVNLKLQSIDSIW